MKTRWPVLLACLASFVAAASGANWPQWRGPARDGISRETGLLKEWPKEGPKLLWHAKNIGSGYSTPAVVGERLYLLSNQGMEEEFVKALNVKDGKEIWSIRIGKVGNPNQKPSYPAARSTPTLDGDLLYALGSDGDLVCLERSGGKARWQKNLRMDFGGQPGIWAYAESPLIDGDVLVCTPGGPDATLVALNKKTGHLLWKSVVPSGEQAAYASVIAVTIGGGKQYVQFLQKGLVGVDARNGKFLWRYDKTAQGSPANIPTPVGRDGFIYSATGRGGASLIKLSLGQDSVAVDEVYASPKLPTAIGGAILVGNYLFGTTGQALVCAEFKTGEIKWTDRGVGAGSLCYADGRLYLHSESGELALVEATAEGYREKGRFTPPDQPERGQSKAWAYPVVANGRFYIRDSNVLWCYDVRQAEGSR
jgi:outer membrane protein assembly factor BamB